MQHHVSIDLHQVIAGRHRDSQIARATDAGAIMRLPGVMRLPGKAPTKVLDQPTSLRPGAVICDYELIRKLGLPLDAG
jgi:hypothetical protein